MLIYSCFRMRCRLFNSLLKEIENPVEFSGYCSSHLDEYAWYLWKTVSSDDCFFRMNAVVDKENLYIQRTYHSREHNPVIINIPCDMKWCADLKWRIIGPSFYDSVNFIGKTYRIMLIHYTIQGFLLLQQHWNLSEIVLFYSFPAA